MSMAFLCGSLFAVAGLTLFLGQVSIVEIQRAYRRLQEDVNASFGHDTLIFLDHEP